MNEIDLNLPEADALSYSQIREGEHFEITELNRLFHWESIGPHEDLGLCSEDGFEIPESAANEARACLSLATAYGVEEALSLMDEYAEMMASFYPSDRDAINSAVSCLPVDDRWMAAYRMAQRTKPMPETRTFIETYGLIIAAAVSAAISAISLLPLPASGYPVHERHNGRWFTVENTSYYLRIDEWRKIRGRCYRLLSDHSVDERATFNGTCEAPSGRG